jgi:lipoprotein Spr
MEHFGLTMQRKIFQSSQVACRKIGVPILFFTLALLIQACGSTTSVQRFTPSKVPNDKEMPLENEAPDEDLKIDTSKYNETLEATRLSSNAKNYLADEIQKFMGVRYRLGGLNEDGFDCSGFVFRVFINALGVKLPHSSAAQAKLGKRIEKEDLAFGDLVFFRTSGGSRISHVGVYIGDGKFAHASTTHGVMVDLMTEKYFRTRYAGARRILTFPAD